MRNLAAGDQFIYITRIARRVAADLDLNPGDDAEHFAVAALRVVQVWETHREAAAAFTPRQYVARPEETPYPPNLAFEPRPVAAAARECSIVHDDRHRPHLPDDSTDRMWRRQYLGYLTRQRRSRLRAAVCVVETEDGLDCLQLDPERAPIIARAAWGGMRLNINGQPIPEALAQPIRLAIARSHRLTEG
jgi:hypothetical protein